MIESVRAKYEDGVLKPSEGLEVEEGTEVELVVTGRQITAEDVEASKSTAGAWKDKIDAEQVIREIYDDRIAGSEPIGDLSTG